MFKMIGKKLKYLVGLVNKEVSKDKNQEEEVSFSTDLEKNIRTISERLGTSPDITIRRFEFGTEKKRRAVLVYIDGLTNLKVIQDNILRPLLRTNTLGKDEASKKDKISDYIKENILTAGGIKEKSDPDEVVNLVLSGDTALLIEGSSQSLIFSTRGWEKRGLEEPDTEIIIKGPRIGFVETLRTNTALLRRIIGHPGLTFESLEVGKRTRTEISIVYLKGITEPKLVEEVKRRINRIDTGAILAAGFTEEFIEDAPFSPFPTVAYTERPDVAAAKILEGRVAIITDGTPVVNTVPALFIESFQSPDDYNFRPFYSTIIRWVRYLAFVLSVLSPAIFVSLTTFHQELLPTALLISMAASNEGTPFPNVVEALGLGLVFEILREAGIRLPRPVGQAVSIVGALVIGEAVVSAGLISAPMVIVVALTAIASFVIPTQVGVATLLRLSLTVVAGALGAFGVVIALLAVLVHLASLRSFGVPYLSPLAPLIPKDLKDVAVRAPLWMMVTRPDFIGDRNKQRQEFKLRPQLPDTGKKRKN